MKDDARDAELDRMLASLSVEPPPLPPLALPPQEPPRRPLPWGMGGAVAVVAAAVVAAAWDPVAVAEQLATGLVWTALHPGVVMWAATVLSAVVGLGAATLGGAIAWEPPPVNPMRTGPSSR